MTKVCHITSAHGPEDVRIFHKECVSLAKAGYETYLVQRGESYEKNGVHIVGFGKVTGGRLKRMTQIARRAYQTALSVDADIYHFHDPELLPYGLKLKKKGKKVVFDSHERYVEQIRTKPYLPPWAAALAARLYGAYERRILRQMDAAILPCTFEGKNPFEGQCVRVPIISNAAILGEFYELHEPTAPKKDRQVCYVGGLTENRGITAGIQAAAKAGARLALAGEFSPTGYEDALRAMPEFSCVDYRGKLSRAEVAALLSESCVGLCALLDRGQYWKCDTFGIKVFEYLSMGLPVILSPSSYNRRMIEQYQFGLCADPENPEELVSVIRYLLDHPEEARQMGENGRRAVKEEFNWGVEEKKLLALYEALTVSSSCDKQMPSPRGRAV